MINYDPIMIKMDSLVSNWEKEDDKRIVFLKCYKMMTENIMTAIGNNEFIDNKWADKLLHRFAEYYFIALDEYEQGETCPSVWTIAHKAAAKEEHFILQNLLLGINAHINYDLVLALVDVLKPEWNKLSEEMKKERYKDHCYVNDVIAKTIDSVQDEIIETQKPYMDIFDKLLGTVDEWIISKFITNWRNEVWESALSILSADDASKEKEIIHNIENLTLSRADKILLKF